MKPATTLAAYAASLVLVFGAAVAVGSAVGPVGTASTGQPEQQSPSHSEMTDMTDADATEPSDTTGPAETTDQEGR
jgi:hypothetical protein